MADHPMFRESPLQAMAIIRQKPAELSAREFTERLALQFSQLQTDWRRKVSNTSLLDYWLTRKHQLHDSFRRRHM